MVTTNISDYYSDISIVIFSQSFSPHNYIIINLIIKISTSSAVSHLFTSTVTVYFNMS